MARVPLTHWWHEKFFILFFCLRSVSCALCCLCLWVVNSFLHLRFSLICLHIISTLRDIPSVCGIDIVTCKSWIEEYISWQTNYCVKCGVNIFFIDFSYIHIQLTEDFRFRYIIKIKTEKYHSVGIFPKSNKEVVESGKINTSNTPWLIRCN
jgi:hypothetical protein